MTDHKESSDWVRAIDEGAGYSAPDVSAFRRLLGYMHQYSFYRAICKYAKSGDVVLEAGCGWATSSFALANRKVRIIAIDISETLVVTLQNLQTSLGGDIATNIKFQVGDILKMDIDRPCDLVFSDGTYEHFPELEDRKIILKNTKNILKDGGFVAVAVPNLFNPFFRMVVDAKMPTMHPFTINTLSDELELNGFSVVETGYSFVNPGFEQWVKSRWMIWPIRLVSIVFRFFPKFIQSLIAAHIYCIAKKNIR